MIEYSTRVTNQSVKTSPVYIFNSKLIDVPNGHGSLQPTCDARQKRAEVANLPVVYNQGLGVRILDAISINVHFLGGFGLVH